jgi:signal transduction histidine kinase
MPNTHAERSAPNTLPFSTWLEANADTLIDTAAHELSSDAKVRPQVAEAIGAFFDGMARAAKLNDITQLHVVLVDWAEARSMPIADEPSMLISLLSTIKRVMWEYIRVRCAPSEAINLLFASDHLFTEALHYLAQQEAEALVNTVQRHLQDAQARLAHLEKRKSDFIAVAAHELRTPLTVVEGYTDMLRSSAADETQTMMADGISSGVKRLREIILDMIDVSLINLNLMKDKLRPQPVSLNHLVDTLSKQLHGTLHQRRQTLQVEGIPAAPTHADPDRLYQVIEKVVMNAIKYTPDGGTITIQARQLSNFTDLMVIDSGIGIAPEHLPRIFDMFASLVDVSLHSSGKTKFKGAGPGLGLSIAKGVIEAHGGTIWAQSDGYDEKACPGSTFHIMIPMQ